MEQYWDTDYYMESSLPVPMFAIGCIDNYGTILSRCVFVDQYTAHTPDISRGKRWRWNILKQKYSAPSGNSELTEEENFLVWDYLEKNGYIKPK